MHGSKSLVQEKMILKLKTENKELHDDDLSQETIDFKRINEEVLLPNTFDLVSLLS